VETKEQVANQKKEKRQRDDHQTHFTFGSDVQRYPNSEQVSINYSIYFFGPEIIYIFSIPLDRA
jgi:hypothetical protein